MVMATATPLVYSYTRFSTPEQRKGTGRQRQDQLAETWCAKRGYTLVHNYSDLGVSAYHGKNAVEGNLAEFLRCVDDGRIKPGAILLVESLDRLSRQQINKAAELFLGIVNRGITVVTLADDCTYSAEKLDFSQLVMSLAIFLRANDESKMKSQRKAASWKIKREKAQKESTPLGGNAPRWIKVSNGKYELVPDEAAKVRAIFQDYSYGGMGLYLLSKKYNIPKATISYWLTNPVVLGNVTVTEPGGKSYTLKNLYPAVIDEATWKDAQRAKKDRFIVRKASGRQGFINIFSGLFVDPKGNRFDITRHYGFSSYVSNGLCIQCRPVEIAVISRLADKFVRIHHTREVVGNPKLDQLDRKIEEIKTAIANDTTIAADLIPILKKLRAQRQEAEDAATVTRENVDTSLVASLSAAGEGDRDSRLQLREIVRSTIDLVRVVKVENSGVWYRMVFLEIHTTTGEVIQTRFAFCTRRIGIIRCDGKGYTMQTLAGFGVKRSFDVDKFNPALLDELKRLPLRHPSGK